MKIIEKSFCSSLIVSIRFRNFSRITMRRTKFSIIWEEVKFLGKAIVPFFSVEEKFPSGSRLDEKFIDEGNGTFKVGRIEYINKCHIIYSKCFHGIDET